MIRKFHEAKSKGNTSVELWGTGSPMREFLHVDDLGQAVLYAIENELEDYLYNVGSGVDLSIKDLAILIQAIIGYNGEFEWDTSKPDGTPKKLMDSSKFESEGWRPSIELKQGIELTYEWFLMSQSNLRKVKIR